jgi:uroporphyrin-III C-methyltransferase/precorrin-2 dehydrogenase/sirohydrochlorin ferrochelatase
LLAAAGARVDFFVAEPSDQIRGLAAAPPAGAIILHERVWQPADCAGTAFAVAECADDAEAARFAAAARAAGVPVNVIDRPTFCDFAFGAIVNRSPLVIGISTDGAAPVFAQAIRAKIETLIPKGFARWAEAARRWRPRIQALSLSFRGRRNFWETFADRAIAAADTAPTEAELNALLATNGAAQAGSVVLVGAGPGDPELLTLRAVRALQSADVILFDERVSPEILDFARREARKMLVGKTGDSLMVSLARAGRRVVRLTGGDGRAGAEIAACRAAGIAVTVVPGVTAARVIAGDGDLEEAARGNRRLAERR